MGPLAAVLISLSYLLGVFIAKRVKEELKPGRPYFVLLQHLLVSALVSVVLLPVNLGLAIGAGVVLFGILYALHLSHPFWFAILLGIVPFSPLTSTLIFSYGLVSGTLFYARPMHALWAALVYVLTALAANAW